MSVKFVEHDKNIIVFVGGDKRILRRSKNNGGMVKDTAISITSALNRMLKWVELNSDMVEDGHTDSEYLDTKIMLWTAALDEYTIKRNVHTRMHFEKMPDGSAVDVYTATRDYFNKVMDDFLRDDRVISIIDRYTKANSVDNIEDNSHQDARLASYDIYILSILFTITRFYYIGYLTVMHVGEYLSVISKSLLGEGSSNENEEERVGLADIISAYVIRKHYPQYLGAGEIKFVDRFIYKYIPPYVDKKSKTDSVILEKFAIAGVNKYSVYHKLMIEMMSGLHRIVASPEDRNADSNKDNFDFDMEDPSSRKFYFKKTTKYLSESLNRILNNVICNFKPTYSMKTESSDMSAEKDAFDAHVNENKENAHYVSSIKDDIVRDAIAGIDTTSLVIGKTVNISRHQLGKFIISIYLNYRYGIAEPVNYLTIREYRALILLVYSKINADYPELSKALLGKIFTGVNNISVDLSDFDKLGGIPAFIMPNVQKSLNILSSLVKSRYLTEFTYGNRISSVTSEVKDDLLKFLCNVDNIFGDYREV